MKKFTKLFLSCAAVAAVTAAVATSAMAAEKTLTASYEDGSGNVVITCDSTDEIKTLLILAPDYLDEETGTIYTNKIIQIDQFAEIPEGVVIPALSEKNEADKGTYTVLMGGTSGDIYRGTFSIGGTVVLAGDADGNKRITAKDSVQILQYAAGNKAAIEEANVVAAAYSDGNARVSAKDSVEVLKYAAGDKNREFVGKECVVSAN